MASDLNQFTFSGRLGRDPEERALPSGESVVSFSVACGRSWKDKETGDKRERTEWIRCTCFSQLGKIAIQYLRKGQQIVASGEYHTNKWTDKEGKERISTDIVLREFHMVGGRPDNAGASEKPAQKPAPSSNRSTDYDRDRDDIPF